MARAVARARWLSGAGLAVFLGGAAAAGALQPGYAHRRDFLSALASLGAESRWVGALALTGLAVFHLGAAGAFWTTPGAGRAFRGGAVFVLVGGVAGLVVAASPIACARGAARCADSGGPGGWTDAVHAVGVGVYLVALVGAMLATAWLAWRAGGRWWAVLGSAAFAVASGSAFAAIGPPHAGAWQRTWLAVNIAWVLIALLLTARPASQPRDTRPTLGSHPPATGARLSNRTSRVRFPT